MKDGQFLKKAILIAAAIFFCIGVFYSIQQSLPSHGDHRPYGVFLGIDSTEIQKLQPYDMVVIEPAAFEKKHIDRLHMQGKTVCGYLNVGAIEKERSYYKRFQKITLGEYKNWPEERWVDVSDESWQSFIVKELGKSYAKKGLDCFFLDNTDVYYQYRKQGVYQGLCNILAGLKKHDMPIILNGGDVFVSKLMKQPKTTALFDGVNQETVFTSINFQQKTYHRQQKEMTLYLKQYLNTVKKAKKKVYLLEYGADKELSQKIDRYCKENDFIWFNAESLDLL